VRPVPGSEGFPFAFRPFDGSLRPSSGKIERRGRLACRSLDGSTKTKTQSMKKLIALMALVAFTFAVHANCGNCPGEKKDCDKAKAEGKCPKDKEGKDCGKCPAGGEKKEEKK
jgi:hypothetical protein